MNKNIVFVLGGVVGFGIGVFSCRGYFDRKYREIADAEVASVMERFGRKKIEETVTVENFVQSGKPHILKESIDPTVKRSYKDIIKNSGYSQDEDDDNPPTDMDPYVIDPEDFDTKEDYDVVNLTYFEDGVVVDDNDHVWTETEIEARIGSESLQHFGEYEDDSVHVRNDLMKIDYEILKEDRNYADAMRFRPHMEEDD